jgi:hypothetical protein
MRQRTERMIVVMCILALAAIAARLDERFIGQQDREYISLRGMWAEWRSQK